MFTEPWPNFGQVVIDPKSGEIRELVPFCVSGSPTSCLLQSATVADVKKRLRSSDRPKDIRVHIKHNPKTGKLDPVSSIRFTYGSYRYTRPLTPKERQTAERFDKTGKLPRGMVVIDLDTTGDLWTRYPKATGGGEKTPGNHNGNGKANTKSVRSRSLKEWESIYS